MSSDPTPHPPTPTPSRRALPSVERLLVALEPLPVPRRLATRRIRRHLESLRTQPEPRIPAFDDLLATVRAELESVRRSRLGPVLNATGILAHTNLGRAPLAHAAVNALAGIAVGYSSLELDLESGERGRRGAYAEELLALACEAEAATVVNNGAAALVLILRHLAGTPPRNEVIISRGELIQIGGGFRVPEILESSGARLREIGTTNRTTAADYRAALRPESALVLKVHRSNFHMEGFVDSPESRELADLAAGHGIPFVEDLGSGALVDPAELDPALPSEPRPQEALAAGADLVCFSGDKLLGGPQAGIIAGKAAWITRLKSDPLFRALRCDKLALAALQETAEAYLHAAARRDAGPPSDIPMLDLLQVPVDELRERATRLAVILAQDGIAAQVAECVGEVGGGVSPKARLASAGLDLSPPAGLGPNAVAARLRHQDPPVIATVASGRIRLDLRTILPHQDVLLLQALRHAFART